MATELNYQQASRIRGESVGSLFADQLIAGKGYKEGFKNVVSLKSKAMAKGIKEKFDPLNIAKVLTGGSRLGPALMGKILGRSKKDIEYFAGRAMPIFEKITKLSESESEDDGDGGDTGGNKKDNLKGVKTVLNKILTFLNKSYDKQVTLQEKENNFKESNKLEDDKRHNALLKALGVISSGNVEEEKKSKSLPDFFKKIKDKIKLKVVSAVERKAGEAAVRETLKKAGTAAAPAVVTGAVTAVEAGAAAAPKLTTEAVEKSLGSILKHEAANIAGKAVPFVAPAVSGGIAISRARDGDWVGAGISLLEAGVGAIPYAFVNPLSGALLPAATALSMGGVVALTAYDITRSVYKDIFKVFPEQENDKELKIQRMKFIYEIVKKMVGANMQSIKSEDVPDPKKLSQQIENTQTTISSLTDQIGTARTNAVMGNKPGAYNNVANLETQRADQQKKLDNLKEIQKQQSQSATTDNTATPVTAEPNVISDETNTKVNPATGNMSATPVANDKKTGTSAMNNEVIPKGWTLNELKKEGFRYDEMSKTWAVQVENKKYPERPDVFYVGEDGKLIKTYFDGKVQKQEIIPYTHKKVSALTTDSNLNIEPMDNTNPIYSAYTQSETDNKDLTIAQATTKNSQSKSNTNDVSVANAPESAVKLPLDTLPVRHMDLQKTMSSLTYA